MAIISEVQLACYSISQCAYTRLRLTVECPGHQFARCGAIWPVNSATGGRPARVDPPIRGLADADPVADRRRPGAGGRTAAQRAHAGRRPSVSRTTVSRRARGNLALPGEVAAARDPRPFSPRGGRRHVESSRHHARSAGGCENLGPDRLFRDGAQEALIGAFRERAMAACQSEQIFRAGAGGPLWTRPNSVDVVIGRSNVDVRIWQLRSERWPVRFRHPHVVLTLAGGETTPHMRIRRHRGPRLHHRDVERAPR